MSNIPKTRVRRTLRRTLRRDRHLWEVTLGYHPIAKFDNHPDALDYAHSYAAKAQRRHVEKLERNAYEARRAAEKAAGKRHSEFMDPMGRIWALAA